ncbi:MAG: exodeoxyribonuclease VII large subunit, partial [Candidatus Omnitrophica bacterium]|nr:exodeoxyribonuclease VII large subunit [Candidatus Omnitrophota bacterium]
MPERTGLFDNVNDAFTKSKPRVLSVTELTRDIKLLLENTFTQVWVEGEVSGVSRISTGTVFFTLKDANAQLKCVIFFNVARDIK